MTLNNKLFNSIPYRILFIALWACILAGIIVCIGLFTYVARTQMPDTEELENPEFEESSIVYSDDLVEIDRYFQRNRQWVKYEDLSQNLIDALIATEDYRFFRHSGIDARGTGRAFAYLGTRGGASTITQQLAKQFFTEKRSSNFMKRVWQKMKEWVIAVEFERRYTKEEILAMFLNKFDFNYQANGVGAAANIYFGKDQKDLTVPEAAVLIGMLKNPIIYNPMSASERSQRRRNVVLSQMNKYGMIDDETFEAYREEPIDMTLFSRGENFKGMAPHFMSELKKHIKKVFVEKGITKPGGQPYNLDTDGLEIYTTIDSRYQRHAELAARNQMNILQKKFRQIWKTRDPWTYINPGDDLTKEQIETQKKIRLNKLNELIESTDLYVQLRKKYLNKTISEVTDKIPEARFLNADFKRLIQAEKDEKYLTEILKNDLISKELHAVYLEILASTGWPGLKEKWHQFNTDVKEQLNQRRITKVYNHDGEQEALMTPIDSIKYMSEFMQIGSMSVDPKTGYVKSWVGGTNYNLWKYDHVTSSRQVGSTFKPFLYTAALNYGISPCYKVRDQQYTIPAREAPFELLKSWSPQNSRGKFSDQEITLKDALKESLNSASVYLVKLLESIEPIVDIAEKMGIQKGKIDKVPSIVLGSPSLSVFEMTHAYTTYANDGISSRPIFIKKILHDGITIYEEQPHQVRALPSNINYAMVDLLKHASSVVSYRLQSEFGGKTGTTNNHVDGWFMGITPSLVTGTWVGGDLNWVRFLTLDNGQGSRMARPFFLEYMERLEADPEIDLDTQARFAVPDDIGIELNCDAYLQFESDSTLTDEIEMSLNLE